MINYLENVKQSVGIYIQNIGEKMKSTKREFNPIVWLILTVYLLFRFFTLKIWGKLRRNDINEAWRGMAGHGVAFFNGR